MDTVRTVADLRARVAGWRAAGERVALVATLGSLHAGHIALLEHAKAHADRLVASIFVNPTQFGQGEDFSAYPRDEARDAAMLADAGCDLLYAPTVEEMYPPGFATEVRVRGFDQGLCAGHRPGHLEGVAQIVTKLLNQAQADVTVFGQKDWQQLMMVRRLARDLDIPTRILGAPTVREEDGLAMSSRNRYLEDHERQVAGRLNRILADAGRRIAAGAPVAAECAAARAALLDAGFAAVDYVEVRTAEALEPVDTFDPAVPTRIFAAAQLGRARLIDNMAVEA